MKVLRLSNFQKIKKSGINIRYLLSLDTNILDLRYTTYHLFLLQ